MTARRRILRWGGWFSVGNAALLALVGLRYLWHYSPLEPAIGWTCAGVAYVGQLSALACIPFLLLAPVMLLFPRPRIVLPIAVLLGSVILSFLVLDSLIFADNRYHLSVLTFTLLAPETLAFLAFYFVVAIAIEAMLAQWIWKRVARPSRRRVGWWLAACLGG